MRADREATLQVRKRRRTSHSRPERDIRQMAYRYLGEQLGDWYLQATAAENANAILVTLAPERWFSADFAQMTGR